MRAALRAPLRASDFDPATAIRYSASSLSRASLLQPPAPSIVRRSISSSVQDSRGSCRYRAPAQIAPFASRALFSSKTSTLLGNAGGTAGKGAGWAPSQKKLVRYVVIGGTLVVVAVVFSDDAQHIYRAAQRTGRVVGTLAVCINE